MPFAQVVVDFPERWADQPFLYSVPPELQLQPGWACTVPFGEQRLRGYIASIQESLAQPVDFEIRPIEERLGEGPCWSAEMLDLAAWIREVYVCTLVEALQVVVPPAVLRRLLRPPKVVKRKRPGGQGLGETYHTPALLPEQEECLRQIFQGQAPATLLLEGVTGSGKTEVYLKCLERVLQQGQTAIVLVPEVALTPQAVDRYRGRLGPEVALLHSRLSEAERSSQWQDLRQGRARVALGTRSAVFAPLDNLGLIILDEEHDPSYKQEMSPRYHARQVAHWRALRHRCRLLLGSATPCLETAALARSGRFVHLRLSQRANLGPLPRVEVIDLRKFRSPRGQDLSPPLVEALRQNIALGQQAVLLYNRRGFARFLQCSACGVARECSQCSVAMTVHKRPPQLLCHYCGSSRDLPHTCQACGSPALREMGSGTEHLLEELQRLVPGCRVLRLDRDTTQAAGAHTRLLRSFAQGEADILLGTQMVAKGLDFPGVTLVGVVGADQGLHLPDFRAGERLLQLLVQVSGRAGRGEKPGRVLLQALDAEHPFFDFARRHDYPGFLEEEMAVRKQAGYPPFARLARVVVSGPVLLKVEESAKTLAAWIGARTSLALLGPSVCPLEKLHNSFRWHFLLKGPRLKELSEILRNALQVCKRPASIRWAVDIDPQTIL